MKVAVIMSAYNGEKFILEQVNSILAQKGVCIDLYIRDDGSSDLTPQILETISKENENVHVEYGNNIGYSNSFMSVLESVNDYDYYAFSDQDDYWYPEKIEAACQYISANENKPSLYYSNLYVCNEDLCIRYKTRLHTRKQMLESVVTRRSIAGCTIVINNSFRRILFQSKRSNDYIGSHDNYLVSLCYAVGGEVICDSNAYIKYRQHKGNTSGFTEGLINRLKKEINEIHNHKHGEAMLAKCLIDNYSNLLTPNSERVLGEIGGLDHIGIVGVRLFFSPRYTTGNMVLTIVGKIKIIFGIL